MQNIITLTSREKQILRLVASEYSSREIAKILYISNYTVMTHRQNLMMKLEVKNAAGLVRKGFEVGVLSIEKAVG